MRVALNLPGDCSFVFMIAQAEINHIWNHIIIYTMCRSFVAPEQIGVSSMSDWGCKMHLSRVMKVRTYAQ